MAHYLLAQHILTELYFWTRLILKSTLLVMTDSSYQSILAATFHYIKTLFKLHTFDDHNKVYNHNSCTIWSKRPPNCSTTHQIVLAAHQKYYNCHKFQNDGCKVTIELTQLVTSSSQVVAQIRYFRKQDYPDHWASLIHLTGGIVLT